MCLKYLENPDEALFNAANMIGSDTDTIAAFVGSLIGAFYGNDLPVGKIRDLIPSVQDQEYCNTLANFLWSTNFKPLDCLKEKEIKKNDSLLKILAWELGLHEMF
jgi:hypothetical protein